MFEVQFSEIYFEREQKTSSGSGQRLDPRLSEMMSAMSMFVVHA
jgi:hypothetical protein